MNVVLGVERYIEIQDERKARDVEPSSRDVASHQQANVAAAETFERVHSHRLLHITVEGLDIESVLVQRPRHDIDVALAIAKNQRRLHFLTAKDLAKRFAFVFLANHDQLLVDVFGG